MDCDCDSSIHYTHIVRMELKRTEEMYQRAPLLIDYEMTSQGIREDDINDNSYQIVKDLIPQKIWNNSLYLKHQELTDQDVKFIANEFKPNTTYKILDLFNNNITVDGVFYLNEILKVNKTLIRLNLGCNEMGDQSAQLLLNTLTHRNNNTLGGFHTQLQLRLRTSQV
ncbi:unnamed protein product [Didymodactylos carnosus]|uniref:Uncharacterized protein n=1 Tax=Didymodactylos carnosus TaxID=1234261 RepID=A0A8S2H3B7_9BILA|nr:unnamed protein product [Didymodactylos carnosus]CAF3596668.1 unnamed protein product [Didymodactylos carnosus]